MNYISVCSGIEAATLAWKPIGFNGKTGDNIENIKFHALNAAAEAIQVAAVCEKIARGFEK